MGLIKVAILNRTYVTFDVGEYASHVGLVRNIALIGFDFDVVFLTCRHCFRDIPDV